MPIGVFRFISHTIIDISEGLPIYRKISSVFDTIAICQPFRTFVHWIVFIVIELMKFTKMSHGGEAFMNIETDFQLYVQFNTIYYLSFEPILRGFPY